LKKGGGNGVKGGRKGLTQRSQVNSWTSCPVSESGKKPGGEQMLVQFDDMKTGTVVRKRPIKKGKPVG